MMDYDEDQLPDGWRVRYYHDIGNGQAAMVAGRQTAIEFQGHEVAIYDRLLTEGEREKLFREMYWRRYPRWQRFVAWVRRVVRR